MRKLISSVCLLIIAACWQPLTTVASDNDKPMRVLKQGAGFASGYSHSCAILADGRVQCWGGNQNGQLGNGSKTDFSWDPVTVSGITNAIMVASGYHHSCAALSDGGVRCWGDNSGGQLGDGTTTSSLVPVTVSGITNAATVGAGGCKYSCAVLADGRVRCWGHLHFRAPDKGTIMESSLPVLVSGIADAVMARQAE